jgi:aspartate/methionine/tyrosine aminotransferase
MLTLQALIVTGGKFLVIGPTWPNVRNAASLSGARVEQFDLDFDGVWRLDVDRLIGAMGDDTRVLCVNSPANPTGWTASRDELAALLAACRRTGTWLLSDEVYSRLTFDAPRAPSLLDVSEPEDRVVIVNSFSKTWNMTGWRLGWLVLPEGMHAPFTQTVENNIANVPVFTQHAGAAALNEGDAFVTEAQTRLRARRDFAAELLSAWPGVRFARPEGAFYLFFAVEGVSDSVAYTQRILREAKVGLAPGRAFGDAFDGWLRLTFACGEARLQEAFDRLARFYG